MEALPFIQFHRPNVTFMHDNARPHLAAITRQLLATNNVNVLDWPVNSPDLIPIEQVWDELGRHVRRNHAIHTVNDLQRPYKLSGPIYPRRLYIQRYVNSMRRRITACIAQNGGQEIPTHFIESSVFICELIPPPNEFKPVLLCNCVLQNQV